MKKLFLVLAAVIGAMILGGEASANGGCSGPFCQQAGPRLPFFRQTPVPAFQAAPWYLYWGYNQHFMTPAPMMGAYYGPPMGGGMTNPYFAAPMQMPGQR